jgi:hypothetical protein
VGLTPFQCKRASKESGEAKLFFEKIWEGAGNETCAVRFYDEKIFIRLRITIDPQSPF